jgi:hypothetical protein
MAVSMGGIAKIGARAQCMSTRWSLRSQAIRVMKRGWITVKPAKIATPHLALRRRHRGSHRILQNSPLQSAPTGTEFFLAAGTGFQSLGEGDGKAILIASMSTDPKLHQGFRL